MLYNQPQGGPIQIDSANPLARGQACYVGLTAQPNADPVDGGAWTVGASTTPIAFAAAARGLALLVKGSTPAYVTRPIPSAITASATQPLTIRFRLYFRSVTSISSIMSWGSTSKDGSPRFYARINGSGQLNFYFAGSYHYGEQMVAGREYIITHTFDGATHSTYLNGVLIGAVVGTWQGNAGSFYLGSGYDGTLSTSDFLLSDFAAWNRPLSPNEVVSDASNPWQILVDHDEDEAGTLYVQTAGGPQTYSYTGVGGLVLSGVAAAVKNSIKYPTGGLTFSGTLPNVRGRSVQPSGGIVYSGGTSVLRGALRAATGGLNIAGNAAIIPFTNLQNRIISPVGGVVLAGSAAVLRTLSRVSGGGFILSGHAAIQRSTGGVIVVLGQLNDIIWTKLRIKGGVGTRNDMLNENTYWRQLGSGNSINQVEKDVLTGQGKTGALNEQEKDYWSNL